MLEKVEFITPREALCRDIARQTQQQDRNFARQPEIERFCTFNVRQRPPVSLHGVVFIFGMLEMFINARARVDLIEDFDAFDDIVQT